jgi:hypothetical protein
MEVLMPDLLEVFKKKADDVLGSINRSGGLRGTIDGLRRQMADADRKRAMSRARVEIKRLDGQVSEMVTAIGLQVVGLFEAGKLASPELEPLCQHIVDLKAVVAQQEKELARLEAEVEAEAAALAKAKVEAEAAALAKAKLEAEAVALAKAHVESAAKPLGTPVNVLGATCQKCAKQLPAGATFCAFCGSPVILPTAKEAERHSCSSCGTSLRAGAKFCPKCGEEAKSPPPTS